MSASRSQSGQVYLRVGDMRVLRILFYQAAQPLHSRILLSGFVVGDAGPIERVLPEPAGRLLRGDGVELCCRVVRAIQVEESAAHLESGFRRERPLGEIREQR